MAIKTGHSPAWLFGAAIFSLVELLLWEGSYQKSQPFKLLWVQDPIEQFIVVIDGHQLPL
jgi:hypothetical protein